MCKLGKEYSRKQKGSLDISVALQIMQYATNEVLHFTGIQIYKFLLMQNGMEILIIEYLQVGMCLTYLEELLVG